MSESPPDNTRLLSDSGAQFGHEPTRIKVEGRVSAGALDDPLCRGSESAALRLLLSNPLAVETVGASKKNVASAPQRGGFF